MVKDYRAAVEKQKQKFNKLSPHENEKQVIERRLLWLESNQNKLDRNNSNPRAAYAMLIFNYLNLNEDDVSVIKENDDEIMWHSENFCPTLEACKELHLDTKQICKMVYEKSTQVIVSSVNPQLRFHRDYSTMRPDAPHCKEMIYKIDFEYLMRIAMEEAILSYDEGNKGYGAVVVYGNEIVARAHDTVITDDDPMKHAEVNALRIAAKKIGKSDLCGAVLISTHEPCPMCASLAVWFNITTIVYGASIKETAKSGKSNIMIPTKEVLEKAPVYIELIEGVLNKECAALYK